MAKQKWDKIEPFLPKIKRWLRRGVYEYQIIERLGISKPTWEKYKKERPELMKVIVDGRLLRKDDLIPDLENVLVKNALGYTQKAAEVREIQTINEKKEVTIHRTIIDKTYPPDTRAASILLANFTRNKDQQYSENPGELDIKKQRLELEKKAHKIKESGF